MGEGGAKLNSPQSEEILSAGIDIGTSTTKLVISRLSLRNTSGTTHVPRIEITSKEVLYRSPIFRTPLLKEDIIDMDKIEEIVLEEYRKAGVSSNDIQTGAVIITGETATKSNASDMISRLSDHAGEFLVATAGPDLESMIAAKGSGAYAFSTKTSKTIVNIDIGGGTANIAVYRFGKLQGTCTLHIGGKLIEYGNGYITYIAEPVREVIKKLGLSLSETGPADTDKLQRVTDYMADVIGKMVNGELREDEELLLGKPCDLIDPIDVIMFSGGVSECIYYAENCHGKEFGDIGHLLAESIKQASFFNTKEVIIPEETVRATVLGAGTQTTEISGATIKVDASSLPLRNLPVYTIIFDGAFDEMLNKIPFLFKEAASVYDPYNEGQSFAVYLSKIPLLGFKDIQKLANSLIKAVSMKQVKQPLVIILERDLARSLGQALSVKARDLQLVCIDQISAEHGDYIDIGSVLKSGVVPVVVKTLTFH
nr:ethanolamine ammonia-lyase reactivating factor EutA [Evansella clarkii]